MNKTLKKILLTIIIILGVVYLSGLGYFYLYSYPKAHVNGQAKGLELKNTLFDVKPENSKISIIAKDKDNLEISGSDIDLDISIKEKPEINNIPFLWPVEVFENHDYQVKYDAKMNDDKLKDILFKSDLFKNVQEPQDAKFEFVNDELVIKDEVTGNLLDKDKLFNNVKSAISNNVDEIELEEEYVQPKVSKDDKDLLDRYEKLKKITQNSYKFDFEDRDWVLKGEDLIAMHDEDGGKLNKVKLRKYIADIAHATDTYAKERKFNATDIGEITVAGGIYGWQMNVDKTMDNLIAMMDKGESGNVEIVYNHEGNIRKKDDIGDTYIEIDISRQTLWLYKEGKLVTKVPVVTGRAYEREYSTPVGVNKVWSREKDRYLRGISPSGNKYATYVNYFMPIGWTGSGIHDLEKRTEFGGDVFKYNGTYSCIAMSLKDMKVVFENTPYLTPVVTYESSTNYSPTEFEKQKMIREGEATMDAQ